VTTSTVLQTSDNKYSAADKWQQVQCCRQVTTSTSHGHKKWRGEQAERANGTATNRNDKYRAKNLKLVGMRKYNIAEHIPTKS
jgi:hypothetical protein